MQNDVAPVSGRRLVWTERILPFGWYKVFVQRVLYQLRFAHVQVAQLLVDAVVVAVVVVLPCCVGVKRAIQSTYMLLCNDVIHNVYLLECNKTLYIGYRRWIIYEGGGRGGGEQFY